MMFCNPIRAKKETSVKYSYKLTGLQNIIGVQLISQTIFKFSRSFDELVSRPFQVTKYMKDLEAHFACLCNALSLEERGLRLEKSRLGPSLVAAQDWLQ